MIKPGSIHIFGTKDPLKYVIQYYDDGPREIKVTWVIAKLIWAAMEQGKKELRAELKKALEG